MDRRAQLTNEELIRETDAVLDRWLNLSSAWSDRNRAISDAAGFVDMAALAAHALPETMPNYTACGLSQHAKARASVAFAEAISVAFGAGTPAALMAEIRAAELDFRKAEADVSRLAGVPNGGWDWAAVQGPVAARQELEQRVLSLRKQLDQYRRPMRQPPASAHSLLAMASSVKARLLDIRVTTRGTLITAIGSTRVERLVSSCTKAVLDTDVVRPLREAGSEEQEPLKRAYDALSDHLAAPIVEALTECGEPGESRGEGLPSSPLPRLVYYSPSGPLSRLPLAGLSHEGEYLVDNWAFSVVPHFGFAEPHSIGMEGSVAVCAGDAPLMSSRTKSLFSPDDILDDPTAEQARRAMAGHSIIWFSCHGVFDDGEPLQSTLAVGGTGAEPLTLDALLRDDGLLAGAHVVLAACQVGRAEPLNEHDQLLGFGHALLLKGANSVWASAWDAHEAVASYVWEGAEGLRRRGLHPAVALAQAQRLYKSATAGDLDHAVASWPRLGISLTLNRLALKRGSLSVPAWSPFVSYGSGGV